jgi:uridine phosphorylase
MTEKIIPASELVLNPDGSVYHLKIKPGQLAKTIVIVGDPHRVAVISSRFDSIEFTSENREIVVHTGKMNGKRITALSTGMGTDNIDIVLNELDALVNIDLEKRQAKNEHTSLNIIRLGTSGALQPEIPLNSFILSEYGIGLDGLLNFYEGNKQVNEIGLIEAFMDSTNYPAALPKPYAVKGSEELIKLFDDVPLKGITLTAPGFYGPQGRVLRLNLAYPELNNIMQKFTYEQSRVMNFEMETSALYGLGKLLGHNTITLCVAIANRENKQFNKGYKEAISELIDHVLEKITDH